MIETTDHDIVFLIFLIFAGAAVVATLALIARQALIIGYIVLGVLLGPSCFGLVTDPDLIDDMSQIGIIFLLFLLGLNLVPSKLLNMFKEAAVVTAVSTLVFVSTGFIVAWLFRFSYGECLLIGFAASFSSTIIGLKLLPTTILHHRHTGEIIISVLLLQIKRFDRIQEYIFLLTIGWCLGFAQAAASLGLPHEIGALIAGVALATNPVSLYIAETLRPIRDFFLVIFFFAVGANIDLTAAWSVLYPATCLAALMLLLKPLVYERLFRLNRESTAVAKEAGVRLGQMSEFSLLMIVIAGQVGLASSTVQSLISLATVLTLIGSTTWIVLRYPSPIALNDRLRRD